MLRHFLYVCLETHKRYQNSQPAAFVSEPHLTSVGRDSSVGTFWAVGESKPVGAIFFYGPGSSVGIVSAYGLDGPGI